MLLTHSAGAINFHLLQVVEAKNPTVPRQDHSKTIPEAVPSSFSKFVCKKSINDV